MKKFLFLMAFIPSMGWAGQQVKYVQVSTGALQPGTTAGFVTANGQSVDFKLGPLQITGATCTATSGGGLVTGTRLYWKAYAIPIWGNGSVGSQTGHQEMTMIPNGTVRTAVLTWNTAVGADHYALTRSNALSGPTDGNIITTMTCTGTTCVYTDTGTTAVLGNPWPSTPYGSTSAYVSGGLEMGAGNMPIVWKDYNGTGELRPYIGPTSAGEWSIKSGLGTNKNNVYFLNTNDAAYLRFLQDPNDNSSVINGQNPIAGNDGPVKIISASSTSFIVDNIKTAYIDKNQIFIGTTTNGNQLTFANTANNQSAVIHNPGGSTVADIDLIHNGSPSAVRIRTGTFGAQGFSVTDSSAEAFLPLTVDQVFTATTSVFNSTVNFNSPIVVNSSATVTSTATFSNNLGLSGELRAGLTSSTTGQHLVSQGAGFAPKFQWAGQIIQITTGAVITSSATTSVTYGDTNLSASITPKSTASRIKITVNAPIEVGAANQSGLFTITRNGTNIATGGGTNAIQQVFSAGGDTVYPVTMVTTDSPQSTSSLTYKVQFRVGGGATCTFGSTQVQSIMVLEEIGQ